MYAITKYRLKKIVINDYFETSLIGPGYHLMLADVLTIELTPPIFHLVVAAIKLPKSLSRHARSSGTVPRKHGHH